MLSFVRKLNRRSLKAAREEEMPRQPQTDEEDSSNVLSNRKIRNRSRGSGTLEIIDVSDYALEALSKILNSSTAS